MCELMPVDFHGDTIFCLEWEGQPYAPMRPIVDNMGLGWGSQSQKLNANKDRWNVTMIVTVADPTVGMMATFAKDSKERRMLCMPVRKLPAWLASIS